MLASASIHFLDAQTDKANIRRNSLKISTLMTRSLEADQLKLHERPSCFIEFFCRPATGMITLLCMSQSAIFPNSETTFVLMVKTHIDLISRMRCFANVIFSFRRSSPALVQMS